MKNFIKRRIQKNINPSTSYANPYSRLFRAIVLNKPDYQDYRDEYADAAFNKYLGFPQNKIKESKYKPSKGNKDRKYYTYDDLILSHKINDVLGEQWTQDMNTDFLNAARFLNFGESQLGNYPPVLNDFTYSRGIDPYKGEYISVWDKYDLSPFNGANGKDESFGLGQPFEFYDRLYLDDYYGVNSKPTKGEYYGGYLPEIRITK